MHGLFIILYYCYDYLFTNHDVHIKIFKKVTYKRTKKSLVVYKNVMLDCLWHWYLYIVDLYPNRITLLTRVVYKIVVGHKKLFIYRLMFLKTISHTCFHAAKTKLVRYRVLTVPFKKCIVVYERHNIIMLHR